MCSEWRLIPKAHIFIGSLQIALLKCRWNPLLMLHFMSNHPTFNRIPIWYQKCPGDGRLTMELFGPINAPLQIYY